MPRPKGSALQQTRTYELYKEGLGPTAIFDKLCEDFEDPVSARTVSTWLRGFRELNDEVKNLDAPFEYHRMEEYGLPWEAGGYLMEMWAWIREFRADPAEKQEDPGASPPTVRQVRWWWRVHLVVPEVIKFDVYVWAQAFAWQEMLKDVFDELVNMAGLEAKLAYRPWESTKKERRYLQAIDQMRIPVPANVWEEFLLFSRVRATGQPETPLLGYGAKLNRPESNSMLPSQIYAETDQAHVSTSAELNRLRREHREFEERAKPSGVQ